MNILSFMLLQGSGTSDLISTRDLPITGLSLVELGGAAVFIYIMLRVIQGILNTVLEKRGTPNGNKNVPTPILIDQIHHQLEGVQKEVHDFKIWQNTDGAELFKLAKCVQNEVRELHRWHSRESEDGVKIWYNRKSTETLIRDIMRVLESTSNKVESLMRGLNSQTGSIDTVNQVLGDIYASLSTYREASCPFKDSLKKEDES